MSWLRAGDAQSPLWLWTPSRMLKAVVGEVRDGLPCFCSEVSSWFLYPNGSLSTAYRGYSGFRNTGCALLLTERVYYTASKLS